MFKRNTNSHQNHRYVDLHVLMYLLFGFRFCCSLTTHSAIFQLYSESCLVSKFTPVVGHPRHGQLEAVSAYPTLIRPRGHPKTSLTSLPSEGAHVGICWESNPDLSIHNPARFRHDLYSIMAGNAFLMLRNKKNFRILPFFDICNLLLHLHYCTCTCT